MERAKVFTYYVLRFTPHFTWQTLPPGVEKSCSLKEMDPWVRYCHSQASGNPVKIGDGCATVTGYRLPLPLVYQKPGRRERGFEPEVRISVWLCSSRSTKQVGPVAWPRFAGHFSVKEKDEASLSRGCAEDSLNTFILRFAGVWRFFHFQALRWSLNR